MAVNDIKRVGDVERHAVWWLDIDRQPKINQHPAEPDAVRRSSRFSLGGQVGCEHRSIPL
ncbi:hypothetical protein CK224_25685 [Mesorhizobium sp. WSM3862]|nr:hypothetical protein CK224_25685 [Mesorhizobium sp. WSM3862]